MLSGMEGEPRLVSEESKKRAQIGLREATIEVLLACKEGQDVEESAEEIMEVFGQASGSIAIAAQFGVALASGPQTLADLTTVTICASGKRVEDLDRDEYLAWRKRTLRLVDSLTFSGCGVYEHKLRNGQICYSLLEEGCEDG